MAQITVIYKDFEEMKAVARVILADELKGQAQLAEVQSPVQQNVPEAPVTPVPQAPVAPVVQAPLQQAPVTPPQQAPMQQAPVTPPVQQSVPTPPAAPAVPTATQTYTLDDLARAGMTLMDCGRQADLQGLLASFGVEALPALPKEQYGAFATALRGMGAKI